MLLPRDVRSEGDQVGSETAKPADAPPALVGLAAPVGQGLLQKKIQRRALQRKSATSSQLVQRKGGGGSDIYATARDLTNPARDFEDQTVDTPTVNFYVELLKDYGKSAILAAQTALPGAFAGSDLLRVRTILAFRAQGGADTTARLALEMTAGSRALIDARYEDLRDQQFRRVMAAGNNELLQGYLAFLPAFDATPRRGELDAARWKLLYEFRSELPSSLLRTRAVALAVGAESVEAARVALARTASFGFVEAFAAHAETQATAHRDDVVAEGNAEAHQTAGAERVDAVKNQRGAAYETLTRKQKADVDNGTNKTGTADPTSKATHKLGQKQQELAEEHDFPGIGEREQAKVTQLRDVVGPQKFTERKQEYQQWFASVDFHDDAVPALTAAKENLPLASAAISCVKTQPGTKALLLQSGLDTGELQICLTIPATTLGALVAAGVSAGTVKPYLAIEKGAALLGALQTGAVAAARIGALVASLGKLGANIQNDVERGHLVTLLAGDTPADVVAMFDATPGGAVGRLAFLVVLRVKAQSAADLTTCLRLCGDANWDRSKITTVISACANGSLLTVLRQRIFTQIAGQHDKVASFRSWLDAVALLITKGQMTITKGALDDLGIGNSGVRTLEYACTVKYVGGGDFDTFVIHSHPGVSGASTHNVNASQRHLKPNRHIHGLQYQVSPEATPPAVKALIGF